MDAAVQPYAIGRFQYLPFGVGPRVCIGAAFALQEIVRNAGLSPRRQAAPQTVAN